MTKIKTVSLEVLRTGKLSRYLKNNISFLCLGVSGLNLMIFGKIHFHPKPTKQISVDYEIIYEEK